MQLSVLKKVGRFLSQYFGQFQRFYYPKRQRLPIVDGLADVSLPSLASLSIREVPLSLTGLGVYRGEAIAIRSSQFEQPHQTPLIDKLQYHALGHIDMDMLRKLHCLAHRLEYEKQFYPQMTDSQKQATIILDVCPCIGEN